MGSRLTIAAGLVWALIPALLAPTPAAWAQNQNAPAPSGIIDARVYAAIPAGASIAVVMDQDTDQYERLKAAIETTLRNRGYRVSDDGALVLDFYGSEVIGGRTVDRAANAPANQSLAPVPAHNANLGLLSGVNQDLFGDQASASDNGAASGRRVSLSMTLTDKASSSRLWQGSAMGIPRGADTFAATKSLIPYLVSAFGRTAQGEKFDMP